MTAQASAAPAGLAAPRAPIAVAPTAVDAGATERNRLGLALVASVAAIQVLLAVTQDRSPWLTVVRWAVELPLAIALAEVVHRRVARRGSPVLATAVGATTLTLVGIGVALALVPVVRAHPELRPFPDRPPSLPRTLSFGLLTGLFQAGLWALAFVSPRALAEARLRRAEAERLRADAELAHLRAQLEPHFLLNALNVVAALVGTDPRRARTLLASLGELLHDAVRERGATWRLGDEVAWLRRYAEVLEARYDGSLRFAWAIEPDAEAVVVPRLLLQPIVENAVRHGALGADGPATVWVEARIEAGAAEGRQVLACRVANDGAPPPAEIREGFGLASVRRRLELLSPQARLALARRDERTEASVTLPLAPASNGRP